MSTDRDPTAEGQVVVVGAINVDYVVAADRLPTPGETVVGAGLERHGGGKGANAAVAAARAGATVSLIGAVGADDTGTSALDELRAAGVEVSGVAVIDDAATGVALIVVDPRGDNQIAVGAGANGVLSADWVQLALGDLLPGAGCVLVSTEIPGDAVVAAVDAAIAAGVPCVLNTAPPIPAVLGLLRRGPILTPNATELEALAAMLERAPAGAEELGPFASGTDRAQPTAGAMDRSRLDSVCDAARKLVARTDAPIVVTLGGDGAIVLSPGGDAEHVPPRRAVVRDTTGAGDTFNGVLAARLACGHLLGDAVRFATTAASLSVSHAGARAGMPDAAAIDEALRVLSVPGADPTLPDPRETHPKEIA